jgi:hypothetical protein
MKTAYPRVCLTTLAIAGLTACTSSSPPGAVGGIGGSVLTNFTTWGASIGPGKTLVVAGDSQEGTYTFDVATNRVTASTVEAHSPAGALLTMKFTETITVLSDFWSNDYRLQTASGTDIKFNQIDDDFFDGFNNRYAGFESADQSNIIMLAEVDAFAYQTYGVWITGIGSASGTYGATSVGAPSPAGAIPAAGIATYGGHAGGLYVDSNGFLFFTTAQMNTSVNFFKREVYFATDTTSMRADPSTPGTTQNSALNMTGTLNIATGTNQFTGAVTTNGGMTGTATGRFYGPAIQEIGGTFSTTGTGGQSYTGGFGGVK